MSQVRTSPHWNKPRELRIKSSQMSDGTHKPHWSYRQEEGGLGPDEWPKYYRTGKRQSPIDITVCECLLASVCAGRQHTCCSEHLEHNLPNSFRDKIQINAKQSAHGRKHSNSLNDDSDDQRRSVSPASSSASSRISSQDPGNDSNREAVAETQITYKNQRTRYCLTNKKLFIGYPRYISAVPLSNTGHSWQINIPAELSAHTRK